MGKRNMGERRKGIKERGKEYERFGYEINYFPRENEIKHLLRKLWPVNMIS
jgi:hypothetical protein